MAGVRAIGKNLLTIYVGYKMLLVWWFNEPITLLTGFLVMILIISSVWFLLEIMGIF